MSLISGRRLPWTFWVDLLVEAAAALFSTLSWLSFVVLVAIAIGECAAGDVPESEGNSTQFQQPRTFACECDEVE